MSDAPATETTAPAAKKVKSPAASRKPQVKATHPPTSAMVKSAILALKERSGSSLQAIKKYISANYNTDAEKLSPFIKKYLKKAVADGELIQTKGKGASGSFKLSPSSTEKPKATAKKPSAPKKDKAASTETKPKVKKAASPAKTKKPAAKSVEKKKAAAPAKTAKKASSVKVAKSPKEKSTEPKVAAKKTKEPKPKKASPAKKATPKKAAAPKKK